MVMSMNELLKHGKCCGNDCKNCPWKIGLAEQRLEWLNKRLENLLDQVSETTAEINNLLEHIEGLNNEL